MNWLRIIGVFLCFSTISLEIQAQNPEVIGKQIVRFGIDRDHDSTTGSTWVRANGEPVEGVELLLTNEITLMSTGPMVSEVFLQTFSQGSLGPAIPINAGWPVGLNLGVQAGDVLETAMPLAYLGQTMVINIYADASSPAGGVDVAPGPNGSVFAFSQAIPTLGTWGMFLFLAFLCLAGIVILRRKRLAQKVSLIALAGLFLSAAGVGVFMTDGQVDDWAGMDPLFTDPSGDSENPATDILAGFAGYDEQYLYLRLDLADTENVAPVANDDSAETPEEVAVNIDVLANDTDGNVGDFLTVISTSGPSAGTVVIEADNTVTYTPNQNAKGSDSFTYTVEDFFGLSDTATVSITITGENDPPTAENDAYSLNEGATLNIDAANGVLSNDSDPDTGTTLTANLVSQPANGTLMLQDDGSFSYVHDGSNTTADSFTYRAHDGLVESNEATVAFTIQPVNDAPSFSLGKSPAVPEDAGPQALAGFATDIDDNDGGSQGLLFTITANSNPGLFLELPSVDAANGTLGFTPAADLFGTADITVILSDDGGTANGGSDTSAPQTFTVEILPVNDAPVFIAGSDQNYMGPPTTQTVPAWATGMSPGPANENGQVLSFAITNNTNPALFSAGPAVDPATGDLTYTTNPGSDGSAVITLVLMDDGGTQNGGTNTSTPAMFTMTIAAPSPPTANPDSGYTAYPHVTLAVDRDRPSHPNILSTQTNVLSNDTDAEPGPLAVTGLVGSPDISEPFVVTTPAGSRVMLYADGSFYFTPPPNVTNSVDSFSYVVSDRDGETDTGLVTVTIANEEPVWFLDNTAAAGGDGTSSNPFNNVADFQASNQNEDDIIFILAGNPAPFSFDGQFSLLTGQTLWGEGADFTLTHPEDASTTLAHPAGTRPRLTNSSSDIVVVGGDNTLRGLELFTAGGSGVVNGDFRLKTYLEAVKTAKLDSQTGAESQSLDAVLTPDEYQHALETYYADVQQEGASKGVPVGGNVTIDQMELVANDTSHCLNFGNADGTFVITDTNFSNSNHSGEAIRLEDTSGTLTITNCQFGNHGSVMTGTGTDLAITISSSLLGQTGLATLNKLFNLDFILGGFLNISNTTQMLVNHLKPGQNAFLVNARGVDFSFLMDASSSLEMNAIGGNHAIQVHQFSGKTPAQFLGPVTIEGAGGKGIELDANDGSIEFSNLAMRNTVGTGIHILNSRAIHNFTIHATEGFTNDSGKAIHVQGATAGNFRMAGGLVDANAGGICFQNNNFSSRSTLSNQIDMDNTTGTGLQFSNNAGSELIISGQVDIRAVDQHALVASLNDHLVLNNVTATTIDNGGGGGRAAFCENNAMLMATFPALTANYANNIAIGFNTNGGTTAIGHMSVNSQGTGFVGTATQINLNTDGSSSPTIVAENGPALSVNNAQFVANFDTISSLNSPTTGVELIGLLANSSVSISGVTQITTPTGPGIHIENSAATQINFGNVSVFNRGTHGMFIEDLNATPLQFGDLDIDNALNSGGNGFHVQSSAMNMSTGLISLTSMDTSNTQTTIQRLDSNGDRIPENEDHDGHGIRLIDHMGGFRITGTGDQGNAGTIENMSGDGISLLRCSNIFLDGVTISNIGIGIIPTGWLRNSAIFAVNLAGSNQVANCTISGFADHGGAARFSYGIGVFNTDTDFTEFRVTDTEFFNTSLDFGGDAIYFFTQGTGNGAIIVESVSPLNDPNNRSVFRNLRSHGIFVDHRSSGILTTSITRSAFRDAMGPNGGGGMLLRSRETATMSNFIENCHFENIGNASGSFIGVVAFDAFDDSDYDATVNNCTFLRTNSRGGISARTSDNSTHNLVDFDINITNNIMDDISDEGIVVALEGGAVPAASGQTADIVITNNQLGMTTPVGTSGENGVEIRTSDSSKIVNMLFQGNTINNFVENFRDETVNVDINNNTTLNLSFWGNTMTVDPTSTGAASSLTLETGHPNSVLCLDLNSDNLAVNRNSGDSGFLLQQTNGTLNVESLGGNPASTFLEARNAATVTTMGTIGSSASCPSP